MGLMSPMGVMNSTSTVGTVGPMGVMNSTSPTSPMESMKPASRSGLDRTRGASSTMAGRSRARVKKTLAFIRIGRAPNTSSRCSCTSTRARRTDGSAG